MTKRYIGAGQTLHGHGTLASNGTLVAEGGQPGGVGAAIDIAGPGTNDGTILLDGGNVGGGLGATLIDAGFGTNAGVIGVGGGAASHSSDKQGGSGATLSVTGLGTNTGNVVVDSGATGSGAGFNGGGGVLIDSGMVDNSGGIDLEGGVGDASGTLTVTSTGVLYDTGKIDGSGDLVNDGTISGATAGSPAGMIESVFLTNDGTIDSNGALDIFTSIGGTGALDITAGGLLTIDGAVSAAQSVTFDSATGELQLASPSSFAAPISGFSVGDELNLTGLPYVSGQTSATYANGVLTVTDSSKAGSGVTDTFNLLGVAAGTLFTTSRDATGGVLVQESATCFVRGTLIRTPAGEVAVEDLAIGDEVATLHGGAKPIKWIGRRRYEGRFIAGNHLMLPVCIKAGALAPNQPLRDLHVSPGHALYLDGVLVPAWRLVNGVSITQAETVDEVSYLHIELAEHDVVFAEGTATETFLDEHQRTRFSNVEEYDLLYPDQVAQATPCAPRAEDGFVLQAIQSRVNARAFITETIQPHGALRGFLEVAGPDRLIGWVQDEANPDAPVSLDVIAGGRRVMRILANRYRADVRAAGLGTGCHGFDLVLPPHLGVVEVRRSVDGTVLAPVVRDVERVAA